jgi:predicted ATP-grasp superfamily ATP-dependent carboligase
MLSEFIPGDDTCGANYNSFYVAGVPVQEFTAAKLRLKPTMIGFPTAVVSRYLPEVIELGRSMSAAIGLRGYSCMEFKRDERDERFKLMEVNARHNFSGMLALACGLNFPYLSYLDVCGQAMPARPSASIEGLYWVDEERDIIGLAQSFLGGYRSAATYSEPYRRGGVFAVFSLADPMPALRLVATSVASRLKGQ